jgi:hypothetical protein
LKLAAWAFLIPCAYLPTLLLPFDFVDDGCLVYPAPGQDGYFGRVWDRSVAEFHTRGPFRPVCWAHWEAAASLLGPHAPARRLARLAWAVLATGIFLWLLRELGFPAPAAVATTALALWNPSRGEVWLGLGLTEAYAMPYALLALVSAVRASRSPRPLRWDLLGLACLLAALGIKNTFAALVLPVVWLRLTAAGLALREGWRQHRRAAVALGLTLAFPATHFFLYRIGPHDPSYKVHFTWLQGPHMLRAVLGAANYPFVLAGLAVPLLAGWLSRRPGPSDTERREPGVPPLVRRRGPGAVASAFRFDLAPFKLLASLLAARRDQARRLPDPEATGPPGPSLLRRFRSAVGAGLLLAVLGVAIYLPFDGVAGRYTLPAAWGLDLLVAVLWTALLECGGALGRRFALAALGIWLVGMGLVNLDNQLDCRAHAKALWQALEFVEGHAPPGAGVAWLVSSAPDGGPGGLAASEACHFHWHLEARGRADLAVRTVESAERIALLERTPDSQSPYLVVAGTPPPEESTHWKLARQCRQTYRLGTRSHECFVWVRR